VRAAATVAALLLALSASAQYRPNVPALLGFAVGGSAWGAREAYHADPRVFERAFGVGPYHFLGSNAWERQYFGNRYAPGQHRPEWGNSFRDVWHATGTGSRVLFVGATFAIGAGKKPLRHRLLDLALASAVGSATAWGTYTLLRH